MEAALKLLAARARAKGELDRALERLGHPAGDREGVLSRLAELGYLDDVRFAKDRAASLLREGKYGQGAVLQKLAAHGVTPEVASAALSSAMGELGFDAEGAARALLEKPLLSGALDRKALGKAARLLATRGFSSDVISSVLRSAALDPPDEGG